MPRSQIFDVVRVHDGDRIIMMPMNKDILVILLGARTPLYRAVCRWIDMEKKKPFLYCRPAYGLDSGSVYWLYSLHAISKKYAVSLVRLYKLESSNRLPKATYRHVGKPFYEERQARLVAYYLRLPDPDDFEFVPKLLKPRWDRLERLIAKKWDQPFRSGGQHPYSWDEMDRIRYRYWCLRESKRKLCDELGWAPGTMESFLNYKVWRSSSEKRQDFSPESRGLYVEEKSGRVAIRQHRERGHPANISRRPMQSAG